MDILVVIPQKLLVMLYFAKIDASTTLSDPTWIHPLESTCDILSFDCSSRFLYSVCYSRYLINFHRAALIVDALVTVDQLGSVPACNPFTQYTVRSVRRLPIRMHQDS